MVLLRTTARIAKDYKRAVAARHAVKVTATPNKTTTSNDCLDASAASTTPPVDVAPATRLVVDVLEDVLEVPVAVAVVAPLV